MLKNDRWIKEQAEKGMITPFNDGLVREDNGRKVLSYGVSSYGLDLTLSPKELKIFRHVPGRVVDPKNFCPSSLEHTELHTDPNDGSKFFIIPGHSYGLGFAREYINMPSNVIAICLAKSTYARCAVAVNVTPIEPSWKGYLTLEIANHSPGDVRVYADEGICQLLFFEGEQCMITYADRGGKYQNQQPEITLARV
jgi:dCTP deaminase